MRTLAVKEGEVVTLEADVEIQTGDLMLWTFGAENCLVARADSSTTDITERFRDRLKVDETGSLTISDIRTTDSGHYNLQIINSERPKTKFRRFNVTVTGEYNNIYFNYTCIYATVPVLLSNWLSSI